MVATSLPSGCRLDVSMVGDRVTDRPDGVDIRRGPPYDDEIDFRLHGRSLDTPDDEEVPP